MRKLWHRFVERQLKKHFAKKNVKIEILGSGAKSLAFITDTGNVIRIKPIWLGTYKKEHRILATIAQNSGISTKVPKIRSLVSFPFSLSIHRAIEGQTLEQLSLSPHYNVADFSTTFAADLAEFLSKLFVIAHQHGMKKKFRPKIYSIFNDAVYYLQLRKYVKKRGLLKTYLELRHASKNASIGLIHNDLHGTNIIVNDKLELLGIIDFGLIHQRGFEYNLRKLPPELCELIIEHAEALKVIKIDRTVLKYYHVRNALFRIKKAKSKSDKAEWVKLLKNMF
jgi:aminoglycoside phosphotransferase (APT) family kinase protein